MATTSDWLRRRSISIRLIAKLLGYITFLAPVMVLAFWGMTYLVDCLQTLAAPGAPLVVRFKSRTGLVTLKAESYAYDFWGGGIVARNISVTSPADLRVARAESLTLRLPEVWGGPRPSLDVRIRGIEATLERDANGRYSLLDLLPEPTEEPSTQAYQVEVENADLLLIDRSGPQIWSTKVSIPGLTVDGVGERWRANAEVLWPGGSRTEVIADGRPNGRLLVQGQFARMDVSPFIEPLQRTPEIKTGGYLEGLDAKSLLAEGQFWLERLPGQPIRFQSDLSVVASGVRAWGYAAHIVDFAGRVDSEGVQGILKASSPGVEAQFAGGMSWVQELTGNGQLQFKLRDRSAIPVSLRKQIPPELRFAGADFTGVMTLRGTALPVIHGSASVQAAAWKEEAIRDAAFELQYTGDRLAIRSARAIYSGEPITGTGDLDLKAGRIFAALESGVFAIEDFGGRIGTDRIFGTARAQAFAEGPFVSPQIEVRLKGALRAEIEPGTIVELGPFHALAEYESDMIRIDRLAVAGTAGTATLSGTYRIRDGALDLNAVTTGIDLADLHSQLAGTAIGRFRVTGTAQEFRATGPVELYGLDLQGQLVPMVAGELTLTRDHLMAQNVRASKGAGRLNGSARWTFGSGSLQGEFHAEGLQLHDFAEEGFEGGIDLRGGVIAGTIDRPILEAEARLDDLIAQDLRLDSGRGKIRLEGKTLTLNDAVFAVDQGRFRLDGRYDLELGDGEVKGSLVRLPVDRFQPLLPAETLIQGEIDGDFQAVIADKRLSEVQGAATLNRLSVNGAFFGSGPLQFARNGDEWRGELTIGQPERFVEVSDIRYRPDTGELEATVAALDLPVRNLFFAARPYIVDARGRAAQDPEGGGWIQTLDGVQGRLDLAAEISGKIDDLTVDLQTLLLRETSLNGDPTGQIEAAARRVGRRWTVQKLRWTGGPGILDLTGSLEEVGKVNLDGNLNNFDTKWLAQFVPSLSRLTGDASLFFSVTGDTESPKIEASLSGSFFEVGEGVADPDKRLNLEIYPILVEEGTISGEGRFQYRGFSGTLKGTSPFNYPATIPDDKPIQIDLVVDSRPLSDLKGLIREIDAEKSKGSVSANIRVSGPRGAIKVDGKLEVSAENLYFENFGYGFEGASLTGLVDNDSLDVELEAKTTRGGSIDGSFQLALGNLGDALQKSYEELLVNKVKGNLYLKNIQIDERHSERGSLATTVNGSVNLSGTVGRPMIATFVPIAFENVRGVVPSVFEEATASEQGPIRPEFRVAYIIGTRRSPAQIAATSSDLHVYGGGTLTGRYPSIKADAALTVSSGIVRLPNARIRLLEGGKVRAIFDATLAEPEFRLDVDIEGRTSLSTLRFTNLVERYEIFLEIRGNLLDPAEQLITARSDPPDLTTERILSLLGQIELLQTLSGQFTGDPNRTELERTLAGIALPVVFDPVTEAIAKQFGLEYLSVNYGPLGQTDVTLAKWLGKGFTIQGRREISDPVDGVPDYDIRLTYRPPRSIRTLRDLVFSLGTDQDRPWKIAIEYGKRFRNGGSANPSNLIRIGEKPPPKP